MSMSTCPIATIDAPIDRVWDLVADPSRYDLWWEARTVSIVPEGPAHAGQRIVGRVGALGLYAAVRLTVESVQPEKHQLVVLTHLPLGITAHNHITCTQLGEEQTRVSFG
jgi:hypothetical protein